MLKSGYANTYTDESKSTDEIIKTLERYEQIAAIIPGVSVNEYDVGEKAPEALSSEIEWFASVSVKFLAGPKIFDSFNSASDCDSWLKTLSCGERELISSNRLRVENLSRVNRILAGFTTEAFARHLPDRSLRDTLQRIYIDFNRQFDPEQYYKKSLKDREVLADDLTWRIGRVLRILVELDYLKIKK